jgi:hypothetical protein
MTENVMDFWPEVVWVVGGIVVLLAFGLALALPQISRVKPGSVGHRPEIDETVNEEIGPDGYIDSFANVIEEAGGGLPPVMKVAIPVVLLWWLAYLIFNWAPMSGG